MTYTTLSIISAPRPELEAIFGFPISSYFDERTQELVYHTPAESDAPAKEIGRISTIDFASVGELHRKELALIKQERDKAKKHNP